MAALRIFYTIKVLLSMYHVHAAVVHVPLEPICGAGRIEHGVTVAQWSARSKLYCMSQCGQMDDCTAVRWFQDTCTLYYMFICGATPDGSDSFGKKVSLFMSVFLT